MKPRILSLLRIALSLSLIVGCGTGSAAPTWFLFSDPENRLAPASGTGSLEYYDPDAGGWGPVDTQFGKASAFGLPAMEGGDPDVMAFPACTPAQGYLFRHESDPNGSYGPTDALVSNYTMIFDIFYPEDSDGRWRALWQTDPFNASDSEFFVHTEIGGGIGINGNYRGSVTAGAWHRIAVAVRAAPGEGQAQRFIDGQFVGAVGTTGSGLADRFGLLEDVLLLTDDSDETAPGYLSAFYFADRAMSAAEIAALGGPAVGGPAVSGPPAAPLAPPLARRVGAIGHRGGSFGSAPDNSLSALRQAFLDGAAGVEIDTRLTADGVAVCFHDETVDRTTDGSGFVEDFTLAQLKQLDAGSKYDPSFAGERVPTVAEALAEAKGKGIVYLDIKTGGQANALAAAVAETGFPLEDLWFWTPGNPDYAAEIRAAVPGARILWGAPDNTWNSDPAYFQSLRDLGVVGFSIGGGTTTPEFAARARDEGFIVEVYTVLDPDGMRTAALSGVDYIETDFPATVVALQPPPSAAASGPYPAQGSETVSGRSVLRWVTGSNATAHRIHFGFTSPPPFVREQASDLFVTPEIPSGRTCYWRVDEITPGGVVEGPIWSFSTPPATLGTVMEFAMDGELRTAVGDGVLEFADGEFSEEQVFWGTTDGANVPHIGGQPASYLEIPGFFEPTNGLALTLTGIPASGGNFVNRYSFVFDVLVPDGFNWMPFFNTNRNNTNDSDFFVRNDGAVGIAELGYAPGGTIVPGTWHRVIFSADLTAGVVTYYVDGVPVHQRTGEALTDGRFSLETGDSPTPHVLLFTDNDGETSPVLVSAVAFVDSALDMQQAEDLGPARAGGIFTSVEPPTAPPQLSATRSGADIVLTWTASPSRRLQRSASLQPESWADVPGTAGAGTHTEPAVPGSRIFFRVVE